MSQEEDWVEVVKNFKPKCRKGVVFPCSPKPRSPKFNEIMRILRSFDVMGIDPMKKLDQTNSVARRTSSSAAANRVSQAKYSNLRSRSSQTRPVPVQLLPSEEVETHKATPRESSVPQPPKSAHKGGRGARGLPCRCKAKKQNHANCKRNPCVQCLRRFFEVRESDGRAGSAKNGSNMSRLHSSRDPHQSLGGGSTLRRSSSNESIDRKKPFSRPSFSKTRIDGNSLPRSTRMSSPGPIESSSQLLRQNQELRNRLQEEQSNYRRRLETYKQAQQNQATLVSRLQAKVMQYKQRCNDLETQIPLPIGPPATPATCTPYIRTVSSSKEPMSMQPLPSPSPPMQSNGHGMEAPLSLPCVGGGSYDHHGGVVTTVPSMVHHVHHDEYEDLNRRLDDERRRCEEIMAQNTVLRQQLEESHRVNESLTGDLQKLTNDWEAMRDDIVIKENEWKEEEQAFNDYYNSEHNRLLRMWREVVAVKRNFKDMQTSMKTDINKMRYDILGLNREVVHACGTVSSSVKQASRVEEANQTQMERECAELKAQLNNSKLQFESSRQETAQRDHRIQQLLHEIKTLEDRCMHAENQAAQAQRMNDEIERLQQALRDIAHAVVQDAEVGPDLGDSGHLHLSQSNMSGGLAPRSPKRGHPVRANPALAEGTISAVQAALHKYQLLLHDLQVKLQSNGDSHAMTKKQLDSTEHTNQLLTGKLSELTEKLDATNYQLSELCKERDSLQKTLENIRSEKFCIERGKSELNSIVDSLNVDYEKLQHQNAKLQKLIDSLDEEKKFVELELQRTIKDKEILEMNLRAEEERCSRLREETITLREELNKVYLSRDILEQQRIEADNLVAVLEKHKSDLEFELDKISCERCELKEQLDKSMCGGEGMSQEIKHLKGLILELEDDRNKYKVQSTELTNDVASLKKELISAEQIKLDLDSEKLNLSEKLKFQEIEKEKICQELNQVARERSDLTNQMAAITRKKEAINEELLRTRQRLEQATETNSRLNRNLEELVKDNEEKQVVIEGQDKEYQRLQEQLAALRSEKEALEGVLFDTNTTLEATEQKKDNLEREVQDLLIKQESLKNTILRVQKDLELSERRAQEMKLNLTNAAANQEAEYLQKIANLKGMGDETTKNLNDEKEQMRQALEKKMQQALQGLEQAKDAEYEALKDKFEQLQCHIEAVCQQHEEILIRAENDKQQSLMLAHRDKQAVMEKLEAAHRDLKSEAEAIERLRRETSAKQDKDRNSINQLREELARYKLKLEENKQKYEDDLLKLEQILAALREERENSQKENEELRVQLRLCEDRADSLNCQLTETCRKLKETESVLDAARKELTDTRRALADANIEKEKYCNSNRDLREHVKRIDGSKREQMRLNDEAMQRVATLEENKAILETEKSRLSALLKESETNCVKLSQEINCAQNGLQKLHATATQKDVSEKEMQARLNNEVEERERAQQELHQVKKQLAELETSLHNTRQELGRVRCKANQDEHRFHAREQELMGRMEDGRSSQKRLEDQKHNLEVCLADATQQIQELKARLGGSEGRVKALEENLVHMESCKRETENKLSSIAHTLRRIAGIQLDGSVNMPYRLMSPSRRFSPARGGPDFDSRSCVSDMPLVDVDPDLVRKGVRSLMQQVAQIEREKDDFKAQLATAKKQIQEAADNHAKGENKLTKLQQILRSVQEDKATLESKLSQKGSALTAVEENLKQRSDELTVLKEKTKNLELNLSSNTDERSQCEERLEKCKQAVLRLDGEKRHLQEDLARTEGRASKLDLQRVALEGDIQRLTMALQEKENHLKIFQERFENQGRASTQLEDRCVALKSTVDQLKERLQAAAIAETELRAEIAGLQKDRNEQGHNVMVGQDKMKYLQKSLTNSENERRVLAERLEATQATMNELRRSQQSQTDSLQRLQEQVAEMEVQKSSLESQLRISKWNQETNDQMMITTGGGANTNLDNPDASRWAREKNELKAKLEMMNEKVRGLESEKRSLERRVYDPHLHHHRTSEKYDGLLDSNRLETDSILSRGDHHHHEKFCGVDHQMLDQENRELRSKIRKLENQLMEKEAEMSRLKAKLVDNPKCTGDVERYRSAQVQAERLLEAREQSHRQQILRLENQISMLREQLAQEAKRRQSYIMKSTKAGREMQQLRQTLGDSLRHVAADPLDARLLDSEVRRLDMAMSSLPPSTGRDFDHHRFSPRK